MVILSSERVTEGLNNPIGKSNTEGQSERGVASLTPQQVLSEYSWDTWKVVVQNAVKLSSADTICDQIIVTYNTDHLQQLLNQ